MPEAIVFMQEILRQTKPDFVMEAGVAWGESLAKYAAFQKIQEFRNVFENEVTIPEHNREAVVSTAVSQRITLIEGSSSDPEGFRLILEKIPEDANIPLVLDSDHTNEHVSAELRFWSPIMKRGNYTVVSDTVVEVIPDQIHRPRPWGLGNNPMTGMKEFLNSIDRFLFYNSYSARAFTSFSPSGYLQ